MPEETELSTTERAALDALIPPDQQTGDLATDLAAAGREAWRRRHENTVNGGHVLAALYRLAGTWRTVGFVTGIPWMTARRWSTPPESADADRPEPTDD